MKYGRWSIGSYDRSRAVELTHRGINPLVAVLLSSRGADEEDIEKLTGKRDSPIYDPMLLKDMDKAVEKISAAIEKGDTIAIYGDYDVDGITSSCLLTDYIRSKGARCLLYIPERLGEGYGIRKSTLDDMKKAGIDLVITVDCGMTAVDEVRHAKDIGLDIIVTDHHECGDTLPDAPAVNPKRIDSQYPEKSLAGVGVAFKLACAIEGREHTEEMLERYGDLVAIGTIADVMDVMGENRTLIKRGIEIAHRKKRPGIAALCRAAGIDPQEMTVSSVGFVIAPRINAAGRIGNTDMAVDLIMSESDEEADRLALDLCALNKQRQQLESRMFSEAVEMIESSKDKEGPIVLSSESWHQGVAGIVASRVSEKYHRPSVVICIKDGVGRGSCRSCGDFDLFAAIEYAGEYLRNYGGHKAAAGITINEENIEPFRRKLAEFYAEYRRIGDNTVCNIDFEVIKPKLLTIKNVEALKALEPYGSGNPTPLLCMLGAETMCVTPLSGGKHMKFKVRKNGECFECVFFGKSPEDIGIRQGDMVDLAFMPQINDYKGRKSVQFLMTDIYVHKK